MPETNRGRIPNSPFTLFSSEGGLSRVDVHQDVSLGAQGMHLGPLAARSQSARVALRFLVSKGTGPRPGAFRSIKEDPENVEIASEVKKKELRGF